MDWSYSRLTEDHSETIPVGLVAVMGHMFESQRDLLFVGHVLSITHGKTGGPPDDEKAGTNPAKLNKPSHYYKEKVRNRKGDPKSRLKLLKMLVHPARFELATL